MGGVREVRVARRRAAMPSVIAVALAVCLVNGTSVLAGNPVAAPQRSLEGSLSEPPLRVATLIGPSPQEPVSHVQSDVDAVLNELRGRQFDQALKDAEKVIRADPRDPRGYNLQGAAYLGKKDDANARKSFEKALEMRPGDVPTLMNLARLDLQRKDSASARKRYQAILKKNLKYIPAMIGMSNAEAIVNNDKEAVAWLEKAKASDPGDVAPRLALANYQHLRGNDQAALAEATETLRRHPDQPDVLYLLGRIQIARGETADAVSTYTRLASLTPTSPAAYFGLGMAQIKAQDFSSAGESLKKAIALRPDYVEAIDALASLDVRAGRNAEALKLARDLQKADPQSAAGPTLEGDVLMSQNRPADAVKAYVSGFKLQQTNLLAIKLHAAHLKAGNEKDADATIEQWLRDHPDDDIVWAYLAGINFQSGRDESAIKQYERLVKRHPKDVASLNNLAILYQRHNDARAIATAERAYSLLPNSSTVTDTLGWILLERGQTARGLELLKKAAAGAGVKAEVRYHLAVGLAKSGDKASARKELQLLLADKEPFPQRDAARQLLDKL